MGPSMTYPGTRTQIESARPAVVYLWAPWFSMHNQLSDKFESISNNNNTIDFYKVNVESVSEALGHFKAREVSVSCIQIAAACVANRAPNLAQVPTFIRFNNKKQFKDLVGVDVDLTSLSVRTCDFPRWM